MTWVYNNQEVVTPPEDAIGFVYLITNTVNGKWYIGKKILQNTRRTKVKNQTRRKIKRVESDWRTYYGSGPLLLEEIEKFGKENFHREILQFCKNKTEMGYYEAKEQFLRGALETNESLNEWIMVRVRKSGLINRK